MHGHADFENVFYSFEYPIPPLDFFDFVQDAFSQKRKVITNSLSCRYEKAKIAQALERCEFAPTTRAEELSPEELLKLYEVLKSN